MAAGAVAGNSKTGINDLHVAVKLMHATHVPWRERAVHTSAYYDYTYNNDAFCFQDVF
jgi:hypothetical protein